MEIETEEEHNEMTQEILNILKSNRMGISQDSLGKQLRRGSKEEQVQSMNKIIEQGLMRLEQNEQGILICYYQDSTEKQILQTLNQEELIIYKLIQHFGVQGIDSRDIKVKSKINSNQVNKLVKKLEKNGMIKAYRQKNKKMWVHYDIEPETVSKAGAFFKEEEVEVQLVSLLSANVLQYLSTQNQHQATKQAVMSHLRSDMNKYELNEQGVQQILQMLILDDKIEEADNSFDGKTIVYRLSPLINMPLLVNNMIKEVPCAGCPVLDQCTPNGHISPINCIYFHNW